MNEFRNQMIRAIVDFIKERDGEDVPESNVEPFYFSSAMHSRVGMAILSNGTEDKIYQVSYNPLTDTKPAVKVYVPLIGQ